MLHWKRDESFSDNWVHMKVMIKAQNFPTLRAEVFFLTLRGAGCQKKKNVCAQSRISHMKQHNGILSDGWIDAKSV